MNAMVEASTAETVARRRASTGSGFASGLGVVVAALIAAVLLAGALVVMASLVLVAVMATLCVAVLRGARHVPWSRQRHVGEAESRPLTVIDSTATVLRTAEGNTRS
jgi:hypothetical protein